MIIRTIIIVIFAYLLFRVGRWLLSSTKKEAITRAPAPSRENLVQDPCCGTYISESKALTTRVNNVNHFFCSSQCRDEYLKKNEAKTK